MFFVATHLHSFCSQQRSVLIHGHNNSLLISKQFNRWRPFVSLSYLCHILSRSVCSLSFWNPISSRRLHMVSKSHLCARSVQLLNLFVHHLFRSFVAILFADALQRMFRITAEVDLLKSGQKGVVQDSRNDTGIAARKF